MIFDNGATEHGVSALGAKVDQVFVMRFWHELGSETTADPDRWRVGIRHVNSRKQLYAVGLEKAFRIVRETLIAENDSKGVETP
jgi:hypothetical protein